MVLDVIVSVITLLSLLALVQFIAIKLPILKAVNPDLPELRQRAVKRDLVEARLARRLIEFKASLSSRFNITASFWQAWKLACASLEKKVEHKILKKTDQPAKTNDQILKAAHDKLQADDLTEAENLYLEAIRREPHLMAGYEGLGEVYLAMRDFEQAREVYEFVAEHTKGTVSHLGLARVAYGQGRLEEAREEYVKSLGGMPAAKPQLELAQILLQLGDASQALAYAAEAKRLEPKNPKILDFYIELSIVNGQLIEAHSALDVLREVNPENQKISEFAREIRMEADKLKPKRRIRSKTATTFGLPLHK